MHKRKHHDNRAAQTMTKRPMYEGLDKYGHPCMQPACVVGDLPRVDIASALEEATHALGAELGLVPHTRIAFGLPVGLAFMSRGDIRKHPRSQLLRTLGDSLSLDHCPSYN